MNLGPILLIGGGGHCVSCIEALESAGWNIAGIIDRREQIGLKVLEYEVIGGDEDLPILVSEINYALVTVGQLVDPGLRMRLYNKARMAGFKLPPIVASGAQVSQHASLGAGTVVLHGATINASASVGENVIVNSGAIVEHEAVINDHCHISTGAIVNGGCRIGEGCFVGSGSVLLNGVKVGDRVVIGAGAVVVSDLLEAGTYIGCPARILKVPEGDRA